MEDIPPPPEAENTSVLRQQLQEAQQQIQCLQQQIEERPSVVVDFNIFINNTIAGAIIGDVQVLPTDVFEPEAGQCFIANCSICQETFQNTQVRILQCGHMFHNTCYETWRNSGTTCPACRNDLSPPQRSQAPLVSEESQEDEDEDEEGFCCAGCESCDFECECRVDVEGELCENCEYEPSLEDAFSKFGHNDGGSCSHITDEVKNIIEGLGYEVKVDSWGMHNYLILEIKRGDEVVYPIDGYHIGGYDERHYSAVLPNDINEELMNSNNEWAHWEE